MSKQTTLSETAKALIELGFTEKELQGVPEAFLQKYLDVEKAKAEAQAEAEKARQATVTDGLSASGRRAKRLLQGEINTDDPTSAVKAAYALLNNPGLTNKEVLEVAEIRGAYNLADTRTLLKILYQEGLLNESFAQHLDNQIK